MRFVSLFVLLSLVGCSARHNVVVVDPTGAPIAGANVEGVSPSMNGSPIATDAKGVAAVRDNVQEVQWVKVSKPGYDATQVAVPDQWPLRVTLQPTPDE